MPTASDHLKIPLNTTPDSNERRPHPRWSKQRCFITKLLVGKQTTISSKFIMLLASTYYATFDATERDNEWEPLMHKGKTRRAIWRQWTKPQKKRRNCPHNAGVFCKGGSNKRRRVNQMVQRRRLPHLHTKSEQFSSDHNKRDILRG